MKSIKLFLAASLVLVSISCFGFDRDKVVTFSNLPKESQKFIKTHFHNVKVSRVVKDIDSFTHSWEVDFVNGWEIEFTGAGKWDHIDCKVSAVPSSVLALLPANILTYRRDRPRDLRIRGGVVGRYYNRIRQKRKLY